MRKILFIIMFGFSTIANAQCRCNCDSLKTFYCIVMFGASGQAIVEDPFNSKSYHVADEKGESAEFHSALNMINFFASKGWEYVEQYGGRTRPAYMLRKKSTTEKRLFDDMRLKEL